MNCKLISLFLAIYIVYMLNFFKTTVNLAHPLTFFDNDYLYHPIRNSDVKQNMICRLGNDASWILALFLLLRFVLLKKVDLRTYSLLVYIVVMIMSFLNFNAVLYLIPYFILELMVIKSFK